MLTTNYIILIQLKRSELMQNFGMNFCHRITSNFTAMESNEEPKESNFALQKIRTIIIVPPPEKQEVKQCFCSGVRGWEDGQRRSEKEQEWEEDGEGAYIGEGDEQGELDNGFDDLRVNKKNNKKGKRDGENIRTYARYDSLIQTLQEELAIHHIYIKCIDQSLFDQFEMKSKRSLERYFFYLCLAKHQGKLTSIIPQLRRKTKKKVIQKGGHRTVEFLETLQGCIDCYLTAAEMLDSSTNFSQAIEAFNFAYLYDEKDVIRMKKPHHNQLKGIKKCMQIYNQIIENGENFWKGREISKKKLPFPTTHKQDHFDSKVKDIMVIKTHSSEKLDTLQKVPDMSIQPIIKIEPPQQNQSQSQEHDMFGEEIDEPIVKVEVEEKEECEVVKINKKKIVGIKNKKQDERDIQKYAKFDIISESSLEFCKRYKINKLIPENSRKLSQRSLHYFFVILALIQRQELQSQFVTHLKDDYCSKIEKRYTQRSPYFRQQLKKSFSNLVEATELLFCGKIQNSLEMAYEVREDRRTHPAKANQLKKCKEIYEETMENFKNIFSIEKSQPAANPLVLKCQEI